MTVHVFTIPALHPEPAQSEFNAFLTQARVSAMQRSFVADGAASYWAFCVDVTDGPARLPEHLKAGARTVSSGGSRGSVDYKDVLSPADFAVFAGLRELRKAVAQREGVPPYAVFTNEQLAAMVQQGVSTKTEFGRIDGIGNARVERYGAEFAAWLGQHRGHVGDRGGEGDRVDP